MNPKRQQLTANSFSFVFFGTPEPAVEILEQLKGAGYLPALVVTNPGAPRDRNLVLTPPPAKEWALRHGIPVLQPENLSDPAFNLQLSTFKADAPVGSLTASRVVTFNLFIVVAYGKIIPKNILDLPARGALNVHYSLLPKYRGATPVETQILEDDHGLGVTIIQLDEKMDHGPIIAQQRLDMPRSWPPKADELRKIYNDLGGQLLVETIPKFISGEIPAIPQDESNATYTKKIIATDRLVDLSADPYKNFLKIQALEAWGTYFFVERNGKKIRVKIKDAAFQNGELKLITVIPEGRKEMPYENFLRGISQKTER